MLKLIKKILQNWIDDIDTGNSLLTSEELEKILHVYEECNKIYNERNPEFFSRALACDYLGISRTTFNNRVKLGKLPLGNKLKGIHELIWYKSDLDNYLHNK